MIEKRSLFISILFIAIVAALGGSSRADAVLQIPLRLLAIIFLLIGLWDPDRAGIGRSKPLLWLMAATISIPAAQLILLPPELWAALPGRAFYADLVSRIGLMETWRPISLTPGMTWNALLALLIPAAMLVLTSQLSQRHLVYLGLVLLVIALFSALLGYIQIAQGPSSGFRYYRPTNNDAMVGFFANRNHHALLLAQSIPILFALAAGHTTNRVWQNLRLPVCIAGGLLIVVTLLLTGSRAGLLLGALGLVAGAAIFGSMKLARPGQPKGGELRSLPRGFAFTRNRYFAPLTATGVVLLAMAGLGSTVSITRLAQTSPFEERRFQLLEPMIELAAATFPLGGGMGSFDRLFRRFEDVTILDTTYVNHAHNEVFQLIIEGGVPALVVLCAFLFWWFRAAISAWRMPAMPTLEGNLARIGSLLTGFAMFASLVDYPLRTPIHASIFVLGCVWLQREVGKARAT